MWTKAWAWAAAAAVVCAQSTPTTTASCKTWNPDAAKATAPLGGIYTTLSPLAVWSPGFGSCLLNSQERMLKVLSSVSDYSECNTTMTWLQSAPLKNMPFQDTNRTQDQAVALAKFLLTLKDSDIQNGCTNTLASVSSCIIKRIVPAMQQYLLDAPCCSSWIQSFTGPTLDVFTANLLKYVSNIVCSTQPISGGTGVRSCGAAFVQAVIPPTANMVDFFQRLSQFIVVPNNQGCLAQEGQPFTDTSGSPHEALFPNTTAFSGCALPLDQFVLWVKAVPYMSAIKAFDPASLFQDNGFVQGQKLLPYLNLFLPSDNNAAMATINAIYEPTRAHLANGYASSCKFSAPSSPWTYLADWPYDVKTTTAPESAVVAQTTTPATTAKAPASSAAASTIGTLVAMLSVLAIIA